MKPHIAYLTSEYPAGSHTFIRREILALEERGWQIERFSIRSKKESLTDPLDLVEQERTFHVLDLPKMTLLLAALLFPLRHPICFWRGLRSMWSYGCKSNRGWVRHIAYLVEAMVLFKEYEKRGVTHTHCHFAANATTVAAILKAMGAGTFSFTVHGPGDFDNPEGIGLTDKVAEAEFVVAISDFCRSQIFRWANHEDWQKVHIVHCCITEDFIHEVESPGGEEVSLLCVGRLSAQKGQLLLLEEIGRLAKEGLPCHLTLAGDGEMRDQIERRIRELGIEGNVTITGWINEQEVRSHIAKAKALVLPSFGEGLPMVIMEALAMGRPVISTNIAAISELVRPKETGWLIAPGNGEQLREAIKELAAAQPSELNAMGATGRSLVMERHMINIEAAKLSDLLATCRAAL